MKYSVLQFFRRLIASLLALFTAIFARSGGASPQRPDAGSVGGYDEASADFRLAVDAGNELHDVSDLLFGAFFEDINFAGDGGLYAEMVANRSFEFTALAKDDALYGWSVFGGASAEVLTNAEEGLNVNNTSYLKLTAESTSGVANRGWLEGMSVSAGDHKLSFYAKGFSGSIACRLTSNGSVLGETVVDVADTGDWMKYSAVITAGSSGSPASLELEIDGGEILLDMVSLFPADTYKGRENGLRRDICEALEEMSPSFLRFPGGCVIEGYDSVTEYDWKDSIGVDDSGMPLFFNGVYGDVAARKQGIDIWTDLGATDDPYPSFMSYGLGFYEFFLLCEDLGCEPVPVLNCGLYCQMRGMHGVDMNSEDFSRYIGNMLDLVEFCRGGEDTVWGAVRVSMGHPEPFALHYLGIGNENELEEYYERYAAFREAFDEAAEADPELFAGVELIYSAGASDATHGTNYIKSYEYAEKWMDENSASALDFAGAIDQHYYNDPEWFLKNADYYDKYGRTDDEITSNRYGGAIPVFVGEYAARSNTLGAALAEGAYMTALERNSDVVRMACYAPLLSSATARHWAPDLIWFNNSGVTPSVNYYMQKLFSTNTAQKVVFSSLEGASVPQDDIFGRVGVGTWNTSASFDNILVVDNETGKTLEKDNFTVNDLFWNWQFPTDGTWNVKNGELVQNDTTMEWSQAGTVAYFGDDIENYTYTLDAVKLDGEEGFLIPFGVTDESNCLMWNIGGWNNTVSCLQEIKDGGKTGQIPGTVRELVIETGRLYKLKVVVDGRNVKCFIDGELYVDYTTGSDSEALCYTVSGIDGDDLIIKLVNVTEERKTVAVDLASLDATGLTASVLTLTGDSPEQENAFGEDPAMAIASSSFTVPGPRFNYTLDSLSATVIRIPLN
ncbi:MAG: hypothetical protein K6C36_06750 [Clostridia bacterium]|nr:hypothetical protein [Clostridia bacterium]